ncbi:fimbrial protein [Providencia rettgeri]|uniref:fimbrial protein n=1 Tax=Providencia TaxID=586 RepID=UPI001E5512D3|nr:MULTISPECIES: fimbrial protein [Providencia]MCX9124185.1 fimbrial protein [Providencia rettgeri]MCX9129349.1 fimbrial protein [Providencia rettgeri]UEK60276.1 fimbrial protein [Providencia rettgeri]HEM6845811.1 fimbrial protein [Providencia rettgeri]
MKFIYFSFPLISLLVSLGTQADVLISLSAKLVRPPCVLTAENGEKELVINFREVALDRLTEEKQSFGILIKQCELRKNLQVYLSPREGSTLTINNETVLATSINGLGIRFSEENKSNALNLNKWERIAPSVSGDTGKVVIQSQLVTNQAIENLTAGPFSAALSVMVDYL